MNLRTKKALEIIIKNRAYLVQTEDYVVHLDPELG